MPASLVKSLSKQSGKSIDHVESLFKKAITSALEQGKKESDKDFYPLVTGILKKMLKIKEGATVTTTSVGNASSLGGSANFADKMRGNKKKEKKFKQFIKKYA